MRKWIVFLLVISMLVCGLASCNDTTEPPEGEKPSGDQADPPEGEKPTGGQAVSGEATTAADLYSAIPAGQNGAARYELQASFRDDTYWYYIYYLGRVRGIPVSSIGTNPYHYMGNTETTNSFKTTEMTGETVAKSFEAANSVTDGWSKDISVALSASLSASVTHESKVGASAKLDAFSVSAQSGRKTTVAATIQAGIEEKFGITSSTQSTLTQYEESAKTTTLTTEKSVTFRFIPEVTKSGYYQYLTLGTADVFGIVIYDPEKNTADITSVSEWLAIYDELVYSETEVFEATSPDKLTLDTDDLEFAKPDTYYESIKPEDLDPVPENVTVEVDLTSFYSSGDGSAKVSLNHDLFNSNTGVFTAKGAYGGKNVAKYVFKGYYQTQNQDGDTSRTMLENFTIQIDAEHDIELVFQNVSFKSTNGLPVIRLNPDKKQNITVTLTVNGESILMGADGANASSTDVNGANGQAAIDFSASENAKLIIGGVGKLTVIGGNGGNGAMGTTGSNGSNGDRLNVWYSTAPSGTAGGNGGKGGDGGRGGNAIVLKSSDSLGITNNNVILVGGMSGNGGNGGRGGNGGNGGWTNSWYSRGGDGGRGGNGGNGGNTYFGASALNVEASDFDAEVSLVSGETGSVGVGGNGGNGGAKGQNDGGSGCPGKEDGNPGANGGKGAYGSVLP